MLPNSLVLYQEGQSIWTRRTRHNVHTHTSNTRQPEPQLKSSSCICHLEPQLKRCHSEPQLKEYHVPNPYFEPQLKGYVLNHNSRNTSKPTFEISPKPYRSHKSKALQNALASPKLAGVAHESLGATSL